MSSTIPPTHPRAESGPTGGRAGKQDLSQIRAVGWAALALASAIGGAAALASVGADWCLVPVSPSRGLNALESYGRTAVTVTVVALWASALTATARRGGRGTVTATLVALTTLAALGYLLIQFTVAPLTTDSPDDTENRLNLIVTVMSCSLLWVAHRLPVVRARAHWVRWPWAAAFPLVMAAVSYEWATRSDRGYALTACVPGHWATVATGIAPVVLSLTTAAIAYSRIPPRGPSAEATA